MPDRDAEERALVYRQRAEEARALAEQETQPEARAAFLKAEASWRMLAEAVTRERRRSR
jgi:hypothetical protein